MYDVIHNIDITLLRHQINIKSRQIFYKFSSFGIKLYKAHGLFHYFRYFVLTFEYLKALACPGIVMGGSVLDKLMTFF